MSDAKYNQSTKSTASILLNGLLEIGNVQGQGHPEFDTINNDLANGHFNLRKKAIRKSLSQKDYETAATQLLKNITPLYEEACKNHGIMEEKFDGREKALKGETIQSLFQKIAEIPKPAPPEAKNPATENKESSKKTIETLAAKPAQPPRLTAKPKGKSAAPKTENKPANKPSAIETSQKPTAQTKEPIPNNTGINKRDVIKSAAPKTENKSTNEPNAIKNPQKPTTQKKEPTPNNTGINKTDVIKSALIHRITHASQDMPSLKTKGRINDNTVLHDRSWGGLDKSKIDGLTIGQIIKDYENNPEPYQGIQEELKEQFSDFFRTHDFKDLRRIHLATKQDVITSALLHAINDEDNSFPNSTTKKNIDDETMLHNKTWHTVDLRRIEDLSLTKIIKDYQKHPEQYLEAEQEVQKRHPQFFLKNSIESLRGKSAATKQDVMLSILSHRINSAEKRMPNAATKGKINDGSVLDGTSWASINGQKIDGLTVGQTIEDYEKYPEQYKDMETKLIAQNPDFFDNHEIKDLRRTHLATKRDVLISALIHKTLNHEHNWPTSRDEQEIIDGTILDGMKWHSLFMKKVDGLTPTQIINEYVENLTMSQFNNKAQNHYEAVEDEVKNILARNNPRAKPSNAPDNSISDIDYNAPPEY